MSQLLLIRLRWTTWTQVCELGFISPENPGRMSETCAHSCGEQGPNYIELDVPTASGGKVTARHGDWILRGEDGNFTVIPYGAVVDGALHNG